MLKYNIIVRWVKSPQDEIGWACSTVVREEKYIQKFCHKTCWDNFKHEGKWENKTKIGQKESGWKVMDWINFSRDRWRSIVNTVINFLVQ
jgi:hypothetical protein